MIVSQGSCLKLVKEKGVLNGWRIVSCSAGEQMLQIMLSLSTLSQYHVNIMSLAYLRSIFLISGLVQLLNLAAAEVLIVMLRIIRGKMGQLWLNEKLINDGMANTHFEGKFCDIYISVYMLQLKHKWLQ